MADRRPLIDSGNEAPLAFEGFVGKNAVPISQIKQKAPDAREARAHAMHGRIVDFARGPQDNHLDPSRRKRG